MVLGRGLRSASWRRWWFCGSLRAQQHAKTEARGDRVMQLMLAAIADAVPLLKEGSRNMVVSCGVQGETRTAVALVPSPSLLMTCTHLLVLNIV
ncbi:3-methyl-2-oxobutanoate hydroxymethyltransferase [Sesbania bispinosa]|nr:3-methyl-2-oxobutanoate hydroxymethyltransferase [Sesbania bispinosa]